jgi:hypothetical protein
MSSVSFLFPNPDPYLASVDLVFLCFEMCVVRVCVCGNTCVCVHVSTILESLPIMGNLRCDWAPISNRFYLV